MAVEVAGQLGLRGVESASGGLDHPEDFKASVSCNPFYDTISHIVSYMNHIQTKSV